MHTTCIERRIRCSIFGSSFFSLQHTACCHVSRMRGSTVSQSPNSSDSGGIPWQIHHCHSDAVSGSRLAIAKANSFALRDYLVLKDELNSCRYPPLPSQLWHCWTESWYGYILITLHINHGEVWVSLAVNQFEGYSFEHDTRGIDYIAGSDMRWDYSWHQWTIWNDVPAFLWTLQLFARITRSMQNLDHEYIVWLCIALPCNPVILTSEAYEVLSELVQARIPVLKPDVALY